ncbi:hypothetical protein IKF73_01300 [Candidatus Saccharibacteria bacterium]|nr:hypothetical protein [Candidatus Saccharibacteria bacterium]
MTTKVLPGVEALCQGHVFLQSVCLTVPKLMLVLVVGFIIGQCFFWWRDSCYSRGCSELVDEPEDDEPEDDEAEEDETEDDEDDEADDEADEDDDDEAEEGDDEAEKDETEDDEAEEDETEDDEAEEGEHARALLWWSAIFHWLGCATYIATLITLIVLLVTGVQWKSLDRSSDAAAADGTAMSGSVEENQSRVDDGAAGDKSVEETRVAQSEESGEGEEAQQAQPTTQQTSSGRAEARRAEKQKKAGAGESEALKAEDQPAPSEEDIKVFEAALAEAERDLSVDPQAALEDSAMERYDDVSWKLSFNSLSATDRDRVKKTGFADALTFGVEAEDEEGIRDEIAEEILRNPVAGVTYAKALCAKTIDGVKTIGDWNPWMAEFIDVAEREGLIAWCEQRNGTTWYVNRKYRVYATALCAFLDRCTYQGVHNWQTSENWCLPATLSDNWRVGEIANYQHSREAHVFAWTAKNGLELFVFGVDRLDKRPEFYGGTPEQPEPFRPGQNPRPTLTPPSEEPPSEEPPSEKPPSEEPPQEEKKDPTERPKESGKNDVPGLDGDPKTVNEEDQDKSSEEKPQNSINLDNTPEYDNEVQARGQEKKNEPEQGGEEHFTEERDPPPEVNNNPNHGNGKAVFGD